MATFALLGAAVFALAVGCSDDDDDGDTAGNTGPSAPTATVASGGTGAVGATGSTGAGGGGSANLSGTVEIDGSSTVFPVTEAVAEEFRGAQPNIQVTVGISGTGGGFERFCNGETDISNASRPISPTDEDEIPVCEAGGIEYIEVPVAYDGLSVVIHPDNDWVTCMTVEELNMIWGPESEGTITKWNQIRPEWPDEDFILYGAGSDSGTFDYFTEVVNGETGAIRTDYTPSEDDNVLVQGVAGDQYALGFFGLAYLEENLDQIKGIEVDGGDGCVAPTAETVESGEYHPLARPLFIYVKLESVETKPQVAAFVDFYLENAAELSSAVGYVRFPDNFYEAITERWTSRETGTTFSGQSGTVAELLGIE
jgi:phosphate transport system substrate-binding protein